MTDNQQLVFNPDGTIDPEQLEGLPEELRERLTSPEFQAMARRQIRTQLLAESRSRAVRYISVQQTIRKNPTPLSRRAFRQAQRTIAKAGKQAIRQMNGGRQ